MCLLLETIKVKGKSLCNIEYHSDRVNRSRAGLFGINDKIDLANEISLAHLEDMDVYKCRVVYNKIIHKIEFVKYHFPKITTLKLVEDNFIDYSYKFENRSNLDLLKQQVANADDILIVKNGRVTDTSFANIVFFDGKNWYTPKSPLLRGTKRQYYLENRIIFEKEIKPESIRFFAKARIINAMIDLDESPDIEIDHIL